MKNKKETLINTYQGTQSHKFYSVTQSIQGLFLHIMKCIYRIKKNNKQQQQKQTGQKYKVV